MAPSLRKRVRQEQPQEQAEVQPPQEQPPQEQPRISVSIVDQLARAREEEDEDDYPVQEEDYSPLGMRDEYPGVVRVKAEFSLGDAEAGAAELVLVDRDWRGSFHEACDSVSQDLQEMSVSYFSRDGATPRLRALKALGDETGSANFVYVASFQIKVPDPSSDHATEALTQLLGLVGAEVDWGCCVYIPEGQPHMTPAEEAACFARRSPWGADTRTAEERAAQSRQSETIRRCCRRDMAPFLRCGFLQADELLQPGRTPSLWCAPSMLLEAPLSHAAAMDDGAATAPPPEPVMPSGADAELREYLMEKFAFARCGQLDVGPIVVEVGRLVNSNGASILGANALHCAAVCENTAPLVEVFLAMGGDINGRDPHGNTPLMVCAGTIMGMSCGSRPPRTGMLRKLVACGADTSLTDGKGRTALGLFHATTSELIDMLGTFGGAVYRGPVISEIEALLMPPGGPSEADVAQANQDR